MRSFQIAKRLSRVFGAFSISFLLVFGMVIPFLTRQEPVKAAWWDSDWDYYKVCNIANADNNYQMVVNVTKSNGGDVDCEGHCNDNFSDIRFVDIDNSTILDCWMEESLSGSYARFWVETPSDVTTDQKLIMYYGNSVAPPVSNGANTFEFFEDFEGTDGDAIDWTGGSATYSKYDNDQVHTGSTSANLTTDTTRYNCHKDINLGSSHAVVMYWGYLVDTTFMHRIIPRDDGNDYRCCYGQFNKDSNTQYRLQGHNAGSPASVYSNYDTDKWVKIELCINFTTDRVYGILDDVGFGTVTHVHSNFVLDRLWLIGDTPVNNRGYGYIDDICVREWTTGTEPSWSSFGSEQQQAVWSNSNPSVSSENPSDGATNVGLSLSGNYSHFNITTSDVDNDNQSVNVTWRTNESGSWKDMGYSESSECNKTFYCTNVSWVDSINTEYWWSVNVSDNHTTKGWTNATYSFTTGANTNPVINTSTIYPANGSTDIPITPTLSVYVSDLDDTTQDMNITWYTNSTVMDTPWQLSDVFSDGQEDRMAIWYEDGDCAYIFGGNDEVGGYFDDVFKWNPGGNPVKVADLDKATSRAGVAYNSYEDRFYIYGGQASGTDIDDIMWFDPGDNTEGTLVETLPQYRDHVRAMYHANNNVTYLFGGTNGSTYFYDVLVHNISAGTVTTLANIDTYFASYQAVYVPYKDAIYLFQGFNSSEAGPEGIVRDRIGIFWCANETFQNISTRCPDFLEGSASLYNSLDGLIYHFGGRDAWYVDPEYEDDIWYFDPNNNSYVNLTEKLLYSVDDFYAVYNISDNRGYLIGTDDTDGADVADQKYICQVNFSLGTDWRAFAWNNSVNNGTYQQNNTNFDESGTTYWWRVVVDDGNGGSDDEIFHFTTAINWNVIDDTINGSYSNVTTWISVIDTINGSYSNVTSWYVLIDTINGSYVNSTQWRVVIDTINGSYSNTTSWMIVDDTVNGSYINVTSWLVINDVVNGSYSNATSWGMVDDTINGSYINTTSWIVVDATVNGSYLNVTEWWVFSDDVNGSYSNTTQWFIISDVVNGSYVNATQWQAIIDTVNGSYSNTTNWLVIDDTINGSYSNVTSWMLVIDDVNGSYSNTTGWIVVIDIVNGSYSNTTSWLIIDDTVNGSYANMSTWMTISDFVNGSYSNSTSWFIVDDVVNGSYSNTTDWQVVIDTVNGSYRNETGWYSIIDTINGSYSNTTLWYIISDVVNGSYSNITSWRGIDDIVNGSYVNVTSWLVLQDDINGSYSNGTNWNVISDVVNGSYLNITNWMVLIDIVNGSYSNTTGWIVLSDDINGSYSNLTEWLVVSDVVNGSYYNSSNWLVVSDDVNGSYINSTSWRTVDSTVNGSYRNSTSWYIISDVVNGSYVNGTSWMSISDDINGSYLNGTSWIVIDTTVNGSYQNSTTWVIVIDTVNGSYSNITSWLVIDDTVNGSYINSTSWLLLDNVTNGSYVNVTSWILVSDVINGSYSNVTEWVIVSDVVNGSYYNASNWMIISDIVNGSYFNGTNWNVIDNTVNGSYSNLTTWTITIDTINGSYSNTTVWFVIDNTINGSYVNVTSWLIIDDTVNGSYSNTTITIWQVVIDTINGSYNNGTSWNLVSNVINGSYSNVSTFWVTINNTINGSYSNITTFIIITDEYPSNSSLLALLQPTVYFTLSNLEGRVMNYSIYIGNSSENTTELLDSEVNVSNGTYHYNNYFTATEYYTDYWWRVYVNDSVSHRNETFSFEPVREGGGIVTSRGNTAMAVAAAALMVGIVGFIFVLSKKRKKKRGNRY